MGYSKLLSPHHVAAAHDWLAESGELYVHIGSQYGRENEKGYFITELGQLKALLDGHSQSSIEIYIFRERQYPVRGIASQQLLDAALPLKVPQGWYSVISLERYPEPIYYLAAGTNYASLRLEIRELEGRMVGIGFEPIESYYDGRSLFREPLKVMYFSASENVESYEEYTESADRYRNIVKNWEDPSWP